AGARTTSSCDLELAHSEVRLKADTTGPSPRELRVSFVPSSRRKLVYRDTVTVTSSSVVNRPSSARARSTYVPGSVNVAVVMYLPSVGTGGACQSGAHGEFAPVRVSSQTLICRGVNVTDAGPR